MDESGTVGEQIDWKTHLLSVWHRRSNKSSVAWRTIWNPTGQFSEWRTSRRIKRSAGENKAAAQVQLQMFLTFQKTDPALCLWYMETWENVVLIQLPCQICFMFKTVLYTWPHSEWVEIFCLELQCCSLVGQRMCAEVPAQQVWVWCRQHQERRCFCTE